MDNFLEGVYFLEGALRELVFFEGFLTRSSSETTSSPRSSTASSSSATSSSSSSPPSLASSLMKLSLKSYSSRSFPPYKLGTMRTKFSSDRAMTIAPASWREEIEIYVKNKSHLLTEIWAGSSSAGSGSFALLAPLIINISKRSPQE